MNNREKYQRSFSVLKSTRTPEWLTKEECTMEKRSGRRFRISRRILILCIMLLSIFALSGITYAATGSTITEHVKIWINGDLVDEKEFESNTDGYEAEAPAAEVDITGETDENGEAEIVLEGEGWKMGFEFGNPESGDEVAPEEGTPEEETTEGSPTDIEESTGDGQ
ncbi:MAG: hypothetical protein II018_00330 [Firmicutes bacterium]|nr:hypothetical protein [Bacillota bacterium]